MLTAFVINGTSAADTINLSWHLKIIGVQAHAFIDWSLNGGATQTQDLTSFTSVTVDTTANSSGGDTVNVLTTPNFPITIVGHSSGGIFGASDTLNVGGANGLQSIAAPLTLSTSGTWNVTLDDSNDAAGARTGTVTSTSFTGAMPGSLSWDTFSRVDNLTFNTGSFGGSTLNVVSGVSGQLTVNGYSQGADDSLVLGSNHVSSAVGPVNIAVAPGSPRGLWNVSIDDSGDNISNYSPGFPVANISAGQLVGLTGTRSGLFGVSGYTGVLWAAGSVRAMTVAPIPSEGVVVDTLDVPMTINTTTDQVQVGNSTSGVQGIAGALSVNGSGQLKLIDTNDVAARSILMSRSGAAVAIDGLAPETISYNLVSTAFLSPIVEMDLPTNFDGTTLSVLASGQSTVLQKVVSPRPVAINVGNVTTAPDIQGTLALYCTGSNLKNTLSVDDSIDSTPRAISVLATKDGSGTSMGVIRGLPGGGDVDYAATQTAGPIVINGGAGGNTFTVAAADPTSTGIAVGTPLTLNLGAGNDSATIKTNAVTVNGQGGNDTVTVDFSTITVSGSGTFGPGNVTFDGGAGSSDTISILGKISTQPFGVVATAVTQGAQTTSFSNVESLALANGAFALANDLNGLNLSLSGSGSTASLSTSQHLGTFSVANSAVATLASSASAWGKTLFSTGLSLATGGTLDLTNNALQVSYISDPAATIRGYLLTGYSNAAWTGAGLRSSTAAGAAKPNVYSLGLGDSADNVVAGLPANTLVVRYTVVGDTNLDGVDNYTDALKLQANFNHTNANWDQADFSYDGVVNSVDAILLARNYLAVLPATAAASESRAPVPTPTTTPTPTPTPTVTPTSPTAASPTTPPSSTTTTPTGASSGNSTDDRDGRDDKHKDHSRRRHGR